MSIDFEKENIQRINKTLAEHSQDITFLKQSFSKYDVQIQAIIDALKRLDDSLNKAVDRIEDKFVTKDKFDSIMSDGKYQKLWWGLIGAIISFVSISCLGYLTF